MSQYCTAAKVYRALGISGIASLSSVLTDADVTEIISDASADADAQTGRSWGLHAVYNEYHDGISGGPHDGEIQVDNGPIVKVLKIEWWDGNAWRSDTEEGISGGVTSNYTYVVYYDMGLIRFNSLRPVGDKRIRVTYTWGDEEVPLDLKNMVADLAAIDLLITISPLAQRRFTMNGLQIEYSGGWEYGQQANMLKNRVNWRMGNLRRFVVATG